MPRANVWIKEKDLEAWNALSNKSEWISDQLTNYYDKQFEHKPVVERPTTTIKEPAKVIDNLKQTKSSAQFCEHYQEKSQCMIKGCKYGR